MIVAYTSVAMMVNYACTDLCFPLSDTFRVVHQSSDCVLSCGVNSLSYKYAWANLDGNVGKHSPVLCKPCLHTAFNSDWNLD